MRGATTATIFYEGGIGVHSFGPFLPWFFRVLDFDAQFCSFLQHRSLRLLVLIVGGLQMFTVFGSFIAHTLHAALECYVHRHCGFGFQ